MAGSVHVVETVDSYGNLFDSIDFDLLDLRGYGLQTMALFNNRNIGDRLRCNLDVGGMLSFSPGYFTIQHVYARTNICRSPIDEAVRPVIRDAFLEGRDEDATNLMIEAYRTRSPLVKAFDEWAHACIVDLAVNERPMLQSTVYDLLGRPARGDATVRPLQHPIIVQPRAGIKVQLSPFSAGERLWMMLDAEAIEPAPLLWVHLEGTRTRGVQ
jgi:hypothetical protein